MQVTKYDEPGITDEKVAYIAREIAMDLSNLEVILKSANVTPEEFDRIQRHPRFQSILENETAAWASALNTNERVKLKASYLMEDWLSGAARDVNDNREPLSSRVQVAKLVTQLAGMGLNESNVQGQQGERVTVTINLGADNKLTFDKQLSAPNSAMKTIEGEVIDGS